MQLIINSDIYGHTAALDAWVESVLPQGWQKLIVSPYPSATNYQIESLAYQAFYHHGGINAYVSRLRQRVTTQKIPSILIGFSAGAAATYKLLAEDQGHCIQRFIGFYPSQIRYFTNLKPSVPSRLIFPCNEPNFDVQNVIQTLEKHQNVSCEMTAYQHGFMNPHSRAFSQLALAYFSQQIAQQLPLCNDKLPFNP